MAWRRDGQRGSAWLPSTTTGTGASGGRLEPAPRTLMMAPEGSGSAAPGKSPFYVGGPARSTCGCLWAVGGGGERRRVDGVAWWEALSGGGCGDGGVGVGERLDAGGVGEAVVRASTGRSRRSGCVSDALASRSRSASGGRSNGDAMFPESAPVLAVYPARRRSSPILEIVPEWCPRSAGDQEKGLVRGYR